MLKISTGAQFLDQFLQGGYDSDVVTTIFGPSGSGKTNLCLLAAISVVNSGKKVLLMDTEGGISVERIRQISSKGQDDKSEKILDKIIFFNPVNFAEQKDFFERLKEEVN